MEQRVQLFPGVTVPYSWALWARLGSERDFRSGKESAVTGTRDFYENPRGSIENILGSLLDSYSDITQILIYFGFSKEERNTFLEKFNGDYNYAIDLVDSALSLAKSFGLTTDNYSRQERKDIFSAIAYFVHEDGARFTGLVLGSVDLKAMPEIMRNYCSLWINGTKSLVPTRDLVGLVEAMKIPTLKDLRGPALMHELGYNTLTTDDGTPVLYYRQNMKPI